MTEVSGVATTLQGSAESVYHEPTSKRIRAVLDGRLLLDTIGARLVWEHRFYPQYYIPLDDIADDALISGETRDGTDRLGPATYYTVGSGPLPLIDGAWRYGQAPDEALRGLVRFDWASAESWFEEDEEVFVHPRSPYVRVDVLDSSREVRVEIDGVEVARSVRPRLLFETGLPVRYYLPKTDVRLDLLTSTDLATSCPYKGTARYWTATVNGRDHPDIVWGYDAPFA